MQYSELVKDKIQQKGHMYFGVIQRLFFPYAFVHHRILMPIVHGMMYQKKTVMTFRALLPI